MVLSGAVQGARSLLNILGGEYRGAKTYLLKRPFYDFGPESKDSGIKPASRDSCIFIDWLLYKNIIDKSAIIEYSLGEEKKEIAFAEAVSKINACQLTLFQRKVSVIEQNLLNALIIGINSFLVDFICNDFKSFSESSSDRKKDTKKIKFSSY